MFQLQRLRPAKFLNVLRSAIAVLSVHSLARAAEGDVFESVIPGTSVTFSASADGSPAPTFQWFKEGATIVGATDLTLTIPEHHDGKRRGLQCGCNELRRLGIE